MICSLWSHVHQIFYAAHITEGLLSARHCANWNNGRVRKMAGTQYPCSRSSQLSKWSKKYISTLLVQPRTLISVLPQINRLPSFWNSGRCPLKDLFLPFWNQVLCSSVPETFDQKNTKQYPERVERWASENSLELSLWGANNNNKTSFTVNAGSRLMKWQI